jgi:hypothetical protein
MSNFNFNPEMLSSFIETLSKSVTEKKEESNYDSKYDKEVCGFAIKRIIDKKGIEHVYVIFNKIWTPEKLYETMGKLLEDYTDDFYNDEDVQIDADLIFKNCYNDIKRKLEDDHFYLLDLLEFFNDEYKSDIKKIENMSADGKINFNGLSSIYTIGKEFVASSPIGNKLVGGIIARTAEQTDGFTNYFIVTGMFTFSTGTNFIQLEKSFSIPQFSGAKKITDLEVRFMTPEDKVLLTERGKKFIKFGSGAKLASYKGNMFRMTQFGPSYFKADGRVMVDYTGLAAMNPNMATLSRYHQQKIETCISIPDDLAYMTWPTMHGFSFAAKQWGEIFVDDLSDTIFDDNAFDQLVLDDEKKKIATALVKNAKLGFTDIISGKSGGVIFLLEGPPGTGKTLTSEALTESQHKPLYSVTVGELGITPADLEVRLVKILEIASSWNANILIDEADVFMEKRSTSDLTRNAMVGIFLRLLERYDGVMFLTTNRADTIDEAVKSRISVTFKYEKLDNNTRFKVWSNLLSAAKILLSIEDIEELSSKHDINGRQIKNAIRTAQCYALDTNTPINKNYFNIVIGLM